MKKVLSLLGIFTIFSNTVTYTVSCNNPSRSNYMIP
jgi:hypothetical protein